MSSLQTDLGDDGDDHARLKMKNYICVAVVLDIKESITISEVPCIIIRTASIFLILPVNPTATPVTLPQLEHLPHTTDHMPLIILTIHLITPNMNVCGVLVYLHHLGNHGPHHVDRLLLAGAECLWISRRFSQVLELSQLEQPLKMAECLHKRNDTKMVLLGSLQQGDNLLQYP